MNTDKKTYRFKLSPEIVEELTYFSKLHQFDDKKDYKEAWKLWITDKKEDFQREKDRLTNLGFKGDFENKLYISARYYYKNKNDSKDKPKKRRKYISCDHVVISLMDDFIKTQQSKPSECYNEFIKKYKTNISLISQITEFRETHSFDAEEINNKLKKTFKNRYFLYKK